METLPELHPSGHAIFEAFPMMPSHGPRGPKMAELRYFKLDRDPYCD